MAEAIGTPVRNQPLGTVECHDRLPGQRNLRLFQSLLTVFVDPGHPAKLAGCWFPGRPL